MTMYVSCIIGLYDPATMEMLDSFTEAMPEIMAAVGMTPGGHKSGDRRKFRVNDRK